MCSRLVSVFEAVQTITKEKGDKEVLTRDKLTINNGMALEDKRNNKAVRINTSRGRPVLGTCSSS